MSLEDEVVQKIALSGSKNTGVNIKDQPTDRPLRSKYQKDRCKRQVASDNSARKQRQLTLAFDESVKTQREKVYHQRNEFIFSSR